MPVISVLLNNLKHSQNESSWRSMHPSHFKEAVTEIWKSAIMAQGQKARRCVVRSGVPDDEDGAAISPQKQAPETRLVAQV